MNHNAQTRRAFVPGFVKLAALVLAALTLCAALAIPAAQAEEWMEPYLEQVQAWGVMKGDANGNLNADREITRAEFVTLVNRAFGYTEAGSNPFTDVDPNDWYAEDISIAYNVGYFQGTSPNTASPLNLVTREQAAVLLGRSLRLQGIPGAANSTFTDMQDIGGWSRGLVQEAAELGIIQGYSDGTFRPTQPITRGQMACFLVRALGTLIQEPGEQTSGGVYGNLTINTPGVVLKDTTITGNLYLTGGVGLGNVVLENVDVLGKIVICGSGEAERGEHSIILRNVTAPSLEVDSLTGQFLSVQAEGLTDIGTATIRTSAYLEDLTEDGLGLQKIRLDSTGEDIQLQLAGNIKDVTNLTPGSALQIAQGIAKVVTVDERAVDSTLTIDDRAVIKELNLDHGTPVTGLGSITHLNINAPGSKVDMLPDTLEIRPGITGNVNNQNMNNITAAESSEDPRILAGYPLARNVAPTSAEAVFRTNKTGTIHWALTAMMDGSLGEEELMNPSNFSAKIIRNGTVNVTASNTDVTARLTGLTREGSYYVSALLVDARGRRSPVKVVAFTTPDDTAPNFATGYPQAPILTVDADNEQIAQIMVMATKSCQMYYVLLPNGAAAPTAADFRAGALPGNLGSGVVTLRKNTPFLLSRINTSYLQEQTTYSLYLWLNDADNGKSSAVRRVQITTKDITAPHILRLDQRAAAARTVTMTFALDEPGTLNWAVVRKDKPFFRSGIDPNNPGTAGQIQIENAIVSGNVVQRGGPVRAARGDTDYTFTISGLEAQTSYDLYYTAKDTAGNYCVYSTTIELPFPIKTLDGQAPTVETDYSKFDVTANNVKLPWADSDLKLEFNEVVLGNDGDVEDDDFLKLYQDVLKASTEDEKVKAKEFLAAALRKYIELYKGTPNSASSTKVQDNDGSLSAETLNNLPEWIDYREAIVTQEDQKTTITFPGANVGVKLQSGSTYFFRLKHIIDTSGNEIPNPTNTPSGGFTTAYATVDMATSDTVRINRSDLVDDSQFPGDRNGTNDSFRVSWAFTMKPNATSQAADNIGWDMLIWSDTKLQFELFSRSRPRNSAGNSGWSKWQQEGLATPTSDARALIDKSGNDPMQYLSLTRSRYLFSSDEYPRLNTLDQNKEYEYAIHLVSVNDNDNPSAWISRINMRITLMAGGTASMNQSSLTYQGTEQTLTNGKDAGALPINIPDPFTYSITPEELDGPELNEGYPEIRNGSTTVNVNLALDRVGTAYFMAVPLTPTTGTTVTGNNYSTPISIALASNTSNVELPDISRVPQNGRDTGNNLYENPMLRLPAASTVATNTSEGGIVWGSRSYPQAGLAGDITLRGLEPNRTYLLLISTRGATRYSDKVYCYTFNTSAVAAPKLELRGSSNIAQARTDADAQVRGLLILDGSLDILKQEFKAGTTANDQFVASKRGTGPNGEYLIIDALIDSYGSGSNVRSSIFDQYALSEVKDQLWGLIEGGRREPNSIIDVIEPFSVNGGVSWSDVRPFTGMKAGRYYCFLAYAESPLGSERSFRATRPLQIADSVGPRVQSATLNYSNGSGQFVVTFTKELYFRQTDGFMEIVPVSPTSMADTLNTGYISVENVVNAAPINCNLVVRGKEHLGNTSEFRWDVRNLEPGSYTFSARPGLCDQWTNGVDNEAFSIVLTVSRNANGELIWSTSGISANWRA